MLLRNIVTHTALKRRNLRTRNNCEDYGVEGWIIFQCIFSKQVRGVDWTDLAEGRNRWRAVTNKVSKLRVLNRRFETVSGEFYRLPKGLFIFLRRILLLEVSLVMLVS